MENHIVPVEAEQRAAEVTELAERYEQYSIVTAPAYMDAGEDLKLIKGKAKEIDELRKSLTKPLDESKKRIMAFFDNPLSLLAKAESAIKAAMLTWQQEQEQIRQERERVLREAARKEEERLRKIKEDAERAWREKEEQAKKAAEQLRLAGEEEKAKRADALAAAAATAADEQAAEAKAVTVIAPVVVSQVEKIDSVVTKTIWKFRIMDENKIPRKYMLPNLKLLGEVARASGDSEKVDGVEFFAENIIAAGRS